MWNEKFGGEDYFYGTQPCQWLVMNRHRFGRGQALAIGDGEGRNGVYLASQGYHTTSLDQSEVGLEKAKRLAAANGVRLTTWHADLADTNLIDDQYDLIAAIYAHLPQPLRATTHAQCASALKPGGLFILEAFHPLQLNYRSGGPKTEDLLYRADAICEELKGLTIVDALEGRTELSEGSGHRGMGYVTRIVARRD